MSVIMLQAKVVAELCHNYWGNDTRQFDGVRTCTALSYQINPRVTDNVCKYSLSDFVQKMMLGS